MGVNRNFARGEMGQIAIRIINENVGKHEGEVCVLLMEALGVNVGRARDFYRTHIRKGNCIVKEIVPDPTIRKKGAVKTKTSKVKVEKAPKVAKPKTAKTPKKVDDRKKFPVIGPDGQTVMRTADEIKEAIERIRLRDQLRAEGATGFAANFNYETREFEPHISETNEVEDLCALFNV